MRQLLFRLSSIHRPWHPLAPDGLKLAKVASGHITSHYHLLAEFKGDVFFTVLRLPCLVPANTLARAIL